MFNLGSFIELQALHRNWLDEALSTVKQQRDDKWSNALAVGGNTFVERVKNELGMKAQYRDIEDAGEVHALCETRMEYTSHFCEVNDDLDENNCIILDQG